LGRLLEIKDVEQFKLDDSSSYDSYAEDYHDCVEKLCKPFVKQMVRLGYLKPGQRVLDVGTGTGAVANFAAKLIGDSGTVIGVDLSEGMLKTAVLSAKEAGTTNVQFCRMDAENLGLPTESFDSVISMYAIDHFPDARSALKEMHRVLKPGGRLVISMGCRIPPWGGGCLKAYWVGITRRIKQIFLPHLYAPNFILFLMKKYLKYMFSPMHSSWGGRNPGKNLSTLVKESGFDIDYMSWDHNMIAIQSKEEFWRFQLALVTEVRKKFQYATPSLRKLFYEKFKDATNAALKRGGRLYYCAAIFIVSGIRK